MDKTIVDVKMVPVHTKISEAFHNFLKDYIAFFGSNMTVEDLCQQMVYEETRRIHHDLTDFVDNDSHFTGKHPWFKKHRDVALTTGDFDPKIYREEEQEESETKEA